MPKLYCDIDIQRSSSLYHMQVSWRGASFAAMDLVDLEVADKETVTGSEKQDNELVYKYIPVGERGKADCEYTVVLPNAEDA